jgi:hypothetical protein
MLALLMHTVLTSGVTTEISGGLTQSVHRGMDAELRLPPEGYRVSCRSFACPAGSLTPTAKMPPPHAQHFVPERFHAILVVRDSSVLEIFANH